MFLGRFQELKKLIEECHYSCEDEVLSENKALFLAHNLIKKSKIVYVIGNGGSAGIASHFSNDLLKALKIPSQTLYDSNVLTCFSNDYGYEFVFSEPLKTLMTPNDLLVAISSSGQSKNILNGVKIAQEKNCPTITLSGFSESNPLRSMGNLNFWLPKSDYGLVEMGHFFLLHTIIDLWKTVEVLSTNQVYA